MSNRLKIKDVPESKVFDFTKIKIENIEGGADVVDVSQIVGNILFNSTPDIMAMDKAKTIYHKGKVELSKKEANYYLNLLLESPAAMGPLKIAMQDFLIFPVQPKNK